MALVMERAFYLTEDIELAYKVRGLDDIDFFQVEYLILCI